MSQFVNFVLTLGQQAAPSFGYASLGLSLEQYGINEVQKYVPGAVPTTAAEQQAYSCGDLTPSEVAAGQTTPTCGVVLATAAGGANAGTATGAPVSSTTNGTAAAGAAGSHSVGAAAAPAAQAAHQGGGANPSVALTGTSSMAGTGINPVPLTALGLGFLVLGIFGRRRALKRRVGDAP